MTEAEGNDVLAAGGHLCARFVADEHGSPITGDRHWRLRWAKLRRTAGRFAAALGLATLLGSRLAGCSTGGVVYAGMYQSAPVDPKAKSPGVVETAPENSPASPR